MFENNTNLKRSLGIRWIKAESGTTYLCPANAVAGGDELSEAELKAVCQDESENPQND